MSNELEIIKKALTFYKEKKYNDAKDILLNFIKNNKNIKLNIDFFYTLYLAFNALKDIKNSKKYLEKCLKINDKNHVILNNLANIFLNEGNFKKAEIFYLKSINLKTDYLLAIVNLAILYQNTGQLENSKKFYIKAIELSPKRISLYFNLSRVDNNFIDDAKIKYLKKVLENEKQEFIEKSYGYFLLANYERKKKNFNLEIDYLKKANEYNFESMKSANMIALNYWKNIILKKYNNFHLINENKKNGLEKLKPIFIIGLPRSGSTITEVLLRTNIDNIKSLGESSIFNGIIAKGFANSDDKKIDLDLVKDKIEKILLDKNFNFKNKIFIDKSLENFFYIDVILKVFPRAKFINTTRNIEDNIFAIYKQSLSNISWTHTIEDILEYIDNYLKIIDYFIKKYPKTILSLDLEELTNNSDKLSKKLYDFCDLKWSEEVLNFQAKKGLMISSASNIQVRDKIKKYEINKYKPYRILLKNFLDKYDWLN